MAIHCHSDALGGGNRIDRRPDGEKERRERERGGICETSFDGLTLKTQWFITAQRRRSKSSFLPFRHTVFERCLGWTVRGGKKGAKSSSIEFDLYGPC